uniref:Uncharacterized protein n=1 Tax=Erwinia amylovora ATCC BAA-2158 TaxID=889211 RepID=E5B304_ERWAM|nr:hypothetical protein predicted by Glimmer/Critica [Erwinia amylovora ATCC BAA-2158]
MANVNEICAQSQLQCPVNRARRQKMSISATEG